MSGDPRLLEILKEAKSTPTARRPLSRSPSKNQVPDSFSKLLAVNDYIRFLWEEEYPDDVDWSGLDYRFVTEVIQADRFSPSEMAAILLNKPCSKYRRDQKTGYVRHTVKNAFETQAAAAQDAPAGESAAPTESITCIRLSDVVPEPLHWLWPGRIPLGKVSVTDGDPGLGKSMLTLHIAACVSTGREIAGADHIDAGSVLVLNAEDGVSDTLVPRLQAAGADLTKTHAIPSIVDRSGERAISLPEDIPLIQQKALELNARLIIFDPLMAFLSTEINSHSDQEVRRAMVSLARLAEKTGAAVVVVRHLNKSPGGSPLYRGGGSIGIIGSARSGMLIGRDPQMPSHRILAMTKSNLAQEAPSLRFHIEQTAAGIPYVVWDGVCEHTAASLLNTDSLTGVADRKSAAEEFLLETLRDGPVSAIEVEKQALKAGIASRTLQRAKKDLGVQSLKEGDFFGTWVWRLNPRAEDPWDPAGTQVGDGLGDVGDLRPGQPT